MLDFQNRNITSLVRQDAREPLNISTTFSHEENTSLISMAPMAMITGDNNYTSRKIISNTTIYSRAKIFNSNTILQKETDDKLKMTNSPETSIVVDQTTTSNKKRS